MESVELSGNTYSGKKSDGVASLDRTCGLQGQGGKGLERDRRIARWARFDEPRGERKDLKGGEGRVKWLGKGRLFEKGTEIGRVAGLDGENGSSCSENCLVRKLGSSTEVG